MNLAPLCLALFASLALAGETTPIVDVHAHLDHHGDPGRILAAVDTALAEMDRNGVRMTLLMPPPQPPSFRHGYDLDALRGAEARHGQRFALLAGGGSLNPMIHGIAAERVGDDDRKRFRKKAEALVAEGIRGFGEIAIHHISLTRMGSNHPYESLPADHPLLLLLVDIAAEHDLPVDLHFDVVPEDMDRPPGPFNSATPDRLAGNLAAFERLLAHNRKAKLIWAHAGSDPLRQRTAALQRVLMQRHENLYSSLRVGTGGPHPTAIVDGIGELKPDWRQLLIDYPDRFMIGSDSFHPIHSNSRRTPAEALERSRRVLEQLPEAVARAIGWGNAIRLFRLPEPRQ